jgi:hypothetical protein
MCNDGYELPPETNSFETCGPTTGYTWSFKKANITNTLLPCIDEFFPGYKLYSETSYFVRACRDLNEAEKNEVKANFAALLNRENVCAHGRSKLCDMSDMGIICGATRRKKRSVDGVEEEEEEETMEIKVTLTAYQPIQKSVDCSRFCPKFNLAGANCEKYCAKAYNRFVKAGMMYVQRKMTRIASRASDMLSFSAAGRVFNNPLEARVSGVEADCPEGTLSRNSMCIPCGPGTHFMTYPNGTAACLKCPAGQFQPQYQQDSCLECPPGTNSVEEGAIDCLPCDEDHYGVGCQHECACVNGDCDPTDGTCECDSGWEGSQCDIDINGCAADPCFEDVHCTDLRAPQTGFQCGKCPDGFMGDGIICEENI